MSTEAAATTNPFKELIDAFKGVRHLDTRFWVPNIVFLGQGNSGEHAWIGYLERYGNWRFDLTKFRNEDYPVGQAFDPQTWRRLTDSECQFLNRRSTTRLVWRIISRMVSGSRKSP